MITYVEGINSLMDAHRLLERSGTPSDAIERLLNAQVAGWVSEGLIEPHMAWWIATNFNEIMIRLVDQLTTPIKLDARLSGSP